MNYPTLEQIEKADRLQICLWIRDLPTISSDEEEIKINLINQKYKDFGGFSPEISKAIGWD